MAQNVEEQVCELVRGYIHLYDATVPGYHDRQHCKNSWEEIASALDLLVKQVQNRWNLARDRFVRAHSKAMAKKSGDAAGGPQHSILQRLAWLKVHVKHRSTLSNFDTQDQAEEEEELEEGVSLPAGHGSSSPPPPSPPPPPPTDSPRPGASKRRTAEVDPVDAALLERLEELRREAQQSKNVFSTFTTYLNTFLQDLPSTDARKLMKDIQQLMVTY
ncbi:hypothetical protein N1851_007880 [Merluccius polli]|uniref:MADF domain-containing protein n=1 Tax=Merluccius polli TaxID=89951 RepID=A0AA47N2G2_MERPO|nr:hypothetical protein N1851_007880 [Merluccius polli]